jgi:nicotinic acid mononucleotide adenylyltransferase
MGNRQSTANFFDANLALDRMRSIDRTWCQSGAAGQAQQYVLLVTSGAYDPMHIKHVEAMQTAINVVSNAALTKVIGARMVISGDAYVTSKLTRMHCVATPQEHRYNMARLAIATAEQDIDLIQASRYEMQFPEFVDFPEVCKAAKAELLAAAAVHSDQWIRDNAEKIKIYYVCGHDHAVKCELDIADRRSGWCDGVVVVGRCSSDTPDIEFSAPHDVLRRSLIHVRSTESSDVSSTRIRKAMLNDEFDSVKKLLHPAVVAYIEEHNLQTKRIVE